jgi:hypothetical protein
MQCDHAVACERIAGLRLLRNDESQQRGITAKGALKTWAQSGTPH